MSRFIKSRAWRRYQHRAPWLRRFGKGAEDSVMVGFWALAGLLPPAAAASLGAGLLGMLGPWTTKHEKIHESLSIAFPAAGEAELARIERQIWRNMGAVTGEYPHLGDLESAGRERGPGILTTFPPQLEPNLHGQRLTVFITGHLANWEVLAVAPRLWGLDLAVVYTPIGNGPADRRLRHYRERMGSRLLPRDKSARELLRHLKSGRPIGIVADHRDDEGEALPFFGQTKMTTLSPARLALKTGADLVPIRVMRLGPAHFEINAAGPIQPPAEATTDAARATAMMTDFNRQLEAWIRERPGEWLCGKRAFSKEVVKALRGASPRAARGGEARHAG